MERIDGCFWLVLAIAVYGIFASIISSVAVYGISASIISSVVLTLAVK